MTFVYEEWSNKNGKNRVERLTDWISEVSKEASDGNFSSKHCGSWYLALIFNQFWFFHSSGATEALFFIFMLFRKILRFLSVFNWFGCGHLLTNVTLSDWIPHVIKHRRLMYTHGEWRNRSDRFIYSSSEVLVRY